MIVANVAVVEAGCCNVEVAADACRSSLVRAGRCWSHHSAVGVGVPGISAAAAVSCCPVAPQ